MQHNILKTIIVGVILGIVLLPTFAYSDTSTLQVNQPVGTNTNSGGGGGGSSGDTTAPQISDVLVQINSNSAIVSWSTNEIALGKLSWGNNQDYGAGQIVTEKYQTKQTAEILNLTPFTQFYFKISAIDQSGNQRVYTGQFLTLSEQDTVSPQNVSSFVVTPTIDRINLFWVNPSDVDFDSVRIVRSERFFPLDPFNGLLIYEGSDQHAADSAVTPGITYYYSIFAKDGTGNYSTGVAKSSLIVWYSELDSGFPDAPVADVNFPQAPGNLADPANFNDFTVRYNNGDSLYGNDTNATFAVPQSALPEGTNSIILTIKDNSNEIADSTYLFAFNKATKEFFATVPNLLFEKSYQLIITIFNGAKQILQTIISSLSLNSANAVSKDYTGTAANALPFWTTGLIGLFIFVLIFYAWFYNKSGSSPPVLSVKPAVRKPSPKKKK